MILCLSENSYSDGFCLCGLTVAGGVDLMGMTAFDEAMTQSH